MSIFVLGINHKSATIALREKIYFPFAKLPLYLQDLLAGGFTEDAVLLSTCNRSELYCATQDKNALYDWFSAQTTLAKEVLQDVLYLYEGKAAVAHMMKVACGLDSMVLGEPQILGQMKNAYAESCAAEAVGPLFHRLFQHIFKVAKEVRGSTAIGACPVSLASMAIHFAQTKMHSIEQAHIVFVGAGETADLLLRYLQNIAVKKISIVNRNLAHAEILAKTFHIEAHAYDQLPQLLNNADLVFSATSSMQPIIHKAILQPRQQSNPLLLIDLAVPRDIDVDVQTLANVSLYCIDDLKDLITTNKQGREHAASKACEMIDYCSEDFMRHIQSHEYITHTIRAYRGQIESICRAELLKAKHQLDQGTNAQQVLDIFARAFTQKLLHAPSVQLRAAGAKGHFELLQFAKQLFALPDEETERL